MKTRAYTFAAILLTATFAASCSTEATDVQSPKASYTETKAAEAELISIHALSGTKSIDEVTGNTESLGAVAYFLPDGQKFPSDADNASVYMPEQGMHYRTSSCNYSASSSYSFPEDGTLTFFSYAPYNEMKDVVKIDPSVKNGVTIPSTYDIETRQESYFMVAKALSNKTGNDSGKGLHTTYSLAVSDLTSMSIRIAEDHETETYRLQSIVMKGHYTKGTYADGWSLTGEQSEGHTLYSAEGEGMEITSEAAQAINTGNGHYLMLPQEIVPGQVTVEVSYTITTGETVQNITREIDMTSYLSEFKAGKQYNIAITLSQSGKITWNPSVAEWSK